MNTVIIVDTNSWKFTGKKNGGFYGNYKFCGVIKKVADFIMEKNLGIYIDIFLPEYVYVEQKQQIKKELHKDLQATSRLVKYKILKKEADTEELLSKWEKSFEKSFKKFLQDNKNIVFIKHKKGYSNRILEGLIQRYIEQKAPFKNRSSFIDTLIWEIVLAQSNFHSYTNIIILTSDTGFQGCQAELERETGKNCYITSNETGAISKLQDLYYNEVKYQDIYEFIKDEYFDNMVLDAIENNFKELFPKEEIASFDTTNCNWIESLQIDDSPDEEDTYFQVDGEVYICTTSKHNYRCDVFIVLNQDREILELTVDNMTEIR